MLCYRRRGVEVGSFERVQWRVGQHHATSDLQVGAYVDQLAGIQQLPRSVVHRLTGEDNRRRVVQV